MHADEPRKSGELVLDGRQGVAQGSRQEILDSKLAAGLRQRLGPHSQDVGFVAWTRADSTQALLHIVDSHGGGIYGGVSPARINRTAGSGSSIRRAMTRWRWSHGALTGRRRPLGALEAAAKKRFARRRARSSDSASTCT